MTITLRLAVALALVAVVSTAGLGLALRENRRLAETKRFDDEVANACRQIKERVHEVAERDARLVGGACRSGELADRTLVAMAAGDLDERRLALRALVASAQDAFGLDGLILVAGSGAIVGASPERFSDVPPARLDAWLEDEAGHRLGAPGAEASILSMCSRSAGRRHRVAMVGIRELGPVLENLARGSGLEARLASEGKLAENAAHAECRLGEPGAAGIPIVVMKSTAELDKQLGEIDRTVGLAVLVASLLAIAVAILLARGLAQPIAQLADEASRVAAGRAQPIEVRGHDEVANLARAFNRMIADLESTRRRLAAASRVAAWREVARRVAHEVKNPLAPIQAAVETLRRLRARSDPAFDDYFDEATRTVLAEVHRISNIVTEFTRFARLPSPKLADVELGALVEPIVALHRAGKSNVAIELVREASRVETVADRDQIVQVVTNLIQNAADACAGQADARIEVRVGLQSADAAHVTVRDNGPGIRPEIAERLFEPYATTKTKGTGLGLAIAQRIAVDHGGELACVATGPRGATFRLVVPIAGPSEPPPSSA